MKLPFCPRVMSFAVVVLSLTLTGSIALGQTYVDQAVDFDPPNPANGTVVTWKPGTVDEVTGLIFGTNAFTSIQAAINEALFDSTVYIASGMYVEGSTVTINKDLTLQGDGAENTILSGSNAYQVLVITSGDDAVIEDLAVVNGNSLSTQAAGVFVGGGTLVMRDCIVTGNHATASNSQGGGIGASGDTTIENTVITGNSSGRGGGLYLYSGNNHSMTNCTIADNDAVTYGGGIYVAGGTVTIAGSTISGNNANLNSSSSVDGGGGIAILNGTVDIRNSTISGNSILRTDGGGIWNDSALTVLHCTITGNSAGGDGGGIAGSGSLSLINSIVAGNTADGNNDDIDGTFPSEGINFIGDYNPPFFFSGSNLTYSGGQTIADIININLADNGGPTPTHRPANGSPVIDAADISLTTNAALTTDQRGTVRIYGPSPDIGSVEIIGPPVFESSDPPSGTTALDEQPSIDLIFDQAVTAGDGAILLRRSDTDVVIPSTSDFSGDTATVTPDAPLPSGLTFYIEIETNGVVNLDGTAFAGISDPTALVFTVCFDTLYVDAAADFTPPNPSAGDPVMWNGTTGSVGGLVFGITAFSSVQDAVDAICGSGTVYIAAGLYAEGSQLDIQKNITLIGDGQGLTQLTGNNSHRVIHVPSVFPPNSLTLQDLDIIDGSSPGDGGGVFMESGDLTVARVTFIGNVANNDGGAISYDGFSSDVVISDTVFIENSAVDSGKGGAIRHDGFYVNFTLRDSIIHTNSSGGGGGVYITASGTSTVLRCSFHGNEVTGVSATIGQRTASGGGMSIIENNAVVLVQDSTFYDNRALIGNGGAIYHLAGTLSVINSTVSDNFSTPGQASQQAGRGAGIFNNDTLNVIHATITANDVSSSAGGGGIWNDGGTVTVANSIVANNFRATAERDIFGPFTAHGVNFIGDLTDSTPSGPGTNLSFGADTINDLLDTNLADNGGPTLTHALVSGSRAIDAGDNAEVPAGLVKDQRNANRIFSGVVDIGALEFIPDALFLSASPAANGPPVPQDVEIVLTFDQAVFAGAGSVVLKDSGSFAIIPSTVVISNDTVTITPVSPLAEGQAFYVEVGVNALINVLDSPVSPILNPETLAYQVCSENVYVSDVWSGANPGDSVNWSGSSGDVTGLVFGVNAFGKLTNAVAAACESGTVHIAPGFYGQADIKIGKDLLLIGDEVNDTLVVLSVGIPHAPIIRVETGAVVTIDRLSIETSVSSNSSGAAVVNDGTLNIRNSSLYGNDSGLRNGGALLNNGTLNIVNSTLSGNDAGRGAGIYNNGGTVTLTQSTVVFNDADLYGGGIFNNAGTVTLINSIVAGNDDIFGSSEIDGTFISSGVNFVGDLSGSTPSGSGTNLTFISTDTDPNDVLRFSPFFYDGPTKTHPLVNGSPAVGVGDMSLLPVGLETDQYGFPRVLGGSVDLGALEFLAAEGDDDGDKVPLLLELILGMDDEVADDDSPRNLGFYISTNGNAVITFGALDQAPPGSRLFVERALALDPDNFTAVYGIELPGAAEEWYGETESVLGPVETMIIDVDSPGTNAFYRLRAESIFLWIDD